MKQLTKEQAEFLKESIDDLAFTKSRCENKKSVLDLIDEYTECEEDEDSPGFLFEDSTVEDLKALRKALDQHLNWEETPQGHSFWNNVDDELEDLINILEEQTDGCCDQDCCPSHDGE